MRSLPGLRRAAALLALGLAGSLTLTACGSDQDADTGAASSAVGGATDAFPITVKHAFGSTTIEKEPARVATWGWGATEAAIATGVYPVAVAEQTWTVGAGNLLPWVEEAYEEADEPKPTVLTDAAGGAEVPYQEFIAAKPDVILAPYSGLTEEQYDTLSDIAPVVAYPDQPWTTPWDETITITATALGRSAKGEEVLEGIDTELKTLAAKYPELAGTTVAGVWAAPNALSVYTGADPRIAVLERLGMKVAPAVASLDTSKGGFYYDLSYEKADELTSDVVLAYGEDQKSLDEMLAESKVKAVPAVGAGRVAQVAGRTKVSAVSPPTALSFTWEHGLPELAATLAAAAKG
ncbi:iron-siderophore ABC transporter substrate-binding protein [Nocardioides sp.]|uniref:iron-siderophore ABC transporter substrate-binding protein n=1 Tax=Nocardioides sp. TaxID=35761 RepID=UPI0035117060